MRPVRAALRNKQMSILERFGVLIILLCCCASFAYAQSHKEPQRGFQPSGSYSLGDIETISNTSGNLMLNIPLASLPGGRGGNPGVGLSLFYNSKVWDPEPVLMPDTNNVTGARYLRTFLKHSPEGGWRYGIRYQLQVIDKRNEYQYPYGGAPSCSVSYEDASTLIKVRMSFPDGSVHEFHPVNGGIQKNGYYNNDPEGRYYGCGNCGSCPGEWASLTVTNPTYETKTYYTIDGTYARLDIGYTPPNSSGYRMQYWTLYFSDGRRVTTEPAINFNNATQRTYDRNGNYTEVSNITYNGHPATKIADQLGRSIVIEYESGNQDQIRATGVGGEQLNWIVKWKTIHVNKTYNAANDSDPSHYHTLDWNLTVVDQIILPQQSGSLTYTFDYNSGLTTPSAGWGEISSVVLPSGARVNYTYKQDGLNNVRSDIVLKNHTTLKELTYLNEYDGTSELKTDTWHYSLPEYVTNQSSITSPDGGVSAEYFYNVVNASNPRKGLVYKSERADGTVIERLWRNDTAFEYPNGLLGNPYVKTEFTSIRDAAGNLSKTAIKDYEYDQNGNVTQVVEYDWVPYTSVTRAPDSYDNSVTLPTGIPGGATLKRLTVNTYHNPSPSASAPRSNNSYVYYHPSSIWMRKAVASIEVRSSPTQAVARTEYDYDNPATTANVTVQRSWDSTKGAYSNPLAAANSVSTSTQYNAYGSPTLSTDARGTQTQYTYGAVGGYTDLYPTITKAAYGTTLELTTTLEYDFYTGAVTRSTDPNNVATATTYDALGRPTLVKAAEGIAAKETRTETEYSDADRRVIVRSDLVRVDLDHPVDIKLVSIQHYDQLGRVRLSRTLENAATESETSETSGVKVQTRYLYSGSHSYQIVSNPYRAQYSHQATSEPSMGWTRSKADSGGRTIEAQTFNGATLPAPWGANTSSSGTVTTAYDAEFTTVTDQTGKVRRSMMNGMGQLARVDEPDKDTGSLGSTASPVQPTSYSYDTLGNLTQVVQATPAVTQTRTFNYSSLSRLTSATNPESGTTSYTYDAGGNLLTKTDARGISITYTYDSLSRNKTVDYSNTAVAPDVERYYDNPAMEAYGRGRYWKDYKGGNETAGSEVEHRAVDAYDALGRPLTQRQKFKTGGVWSQDYTTSRTYTRFGNVELQTLPSGHTVNHTYDAAGRLQSFNGNLGDGTTRTYSTGLSYAAAGQMTREQFGTNTVLYHRRHYNTRGQLYDVRLTGEANGDGFSWNRGAIVAYYDGAYSWSNNGNAATGADNNGNVRRAQVWIPGDDAMSTYTLSDEYFDYDALNRLKSVNEYKEATGVARSHAFVQLYDYDRWGNRTINQAGTTQTLAPEMRKSFEVNPVTNRLSVPSGQLGTMTYDTAGNLTHDSYTGKGDRAYDAENRMTSAVIGINSSTAYTYDADGRRTRRQTPNEQVWQVYGMDGELLAEYEANASPSSPQKEYGYRNGELLITATGGNAAGGGVGGNLAQGKPATQSSTEYGGVASRAVDGNTSGNWNDGSVTHTATEGAPWWQVDLGSVQQLGDIKVWNRTDCCGSVLTNFYVFVSDNPFAPGSVAEQAGVTTYNVEGQAGTPTVVAANRTGRYVRVQLGVYERLSLAEVQVFGAAAVQKLSVTAVTASSTNGTDAPALAVDGNEASSWIASGFPTQWIELDLGQARNVSKLRLKINQYPAGATTHQISGGTSQGALSPLWTHSGTLQSGEWLEATFTETSVRYLRVTTTSGPSWVAWFEIEVYGASGGNNGGGEVNWLVTDHLGTPRMIADLTGSLAGIKRHDYLPFGEELKDGIGGRTAGQGYSGDHIRQQFSGHERDDETGLDYMQARFYMSAQGRFTSCDPITLSKKHVVNPQRWNLYIYVNNNPLALVDPDGRDPQGKDGSKMIDVYLVFTAENMKYAGNWDETKKIAEKNGFTVNVHTYDETRIKDVQNSLKNSYAVVFVGDSGGNFNSNGKYEGAAIDVAPGVNIQAEGIRDTTTIPPTVLRDPDGNYAGIAPTETIGLPVNNTEVTALITCNSQPIASGVNGRTVITNTGGPDGFTSLTAITKTAQTFVSTLAQTSNVTSAVNAGNRVLANSQGHGTLPRPYNDRGDRLVLHRSP